MTLSVHFILRAINMAAGALIVHNALSALDRMSGETRHGVRIAFLLLATGGFAQLLDPWITQDASSIGDITLTCGIAMLMVFDRRCVACPRSLMAGALRRGQDAKSMSGEIT